jgi:hypothetical protein
MERLPLELLFVLGFVALVLFNYFVQRAARRREQQEKTQAAVAPAPPSVEEELPEEVWGRTATPTPPPPPAPVLVPRSAPPPPAPRRLHPVRALLNDKRDLRRAVVLMMVLGPCRAQEPPER